MSLPDKYRQLLLSDTEPGELYRRCLTDMAADGLTADYALTETIVYTTEVRYALDAIRHGRPERLWNFGDLDGRSTAAMFDVLDTVPRMRLAFTGSGPYPITALLAAERYPDATSITCIDNHIVGHLLGQATVEAMKMPIAAAPSMSACRSSPTKTLCTGAVPRRASAAWNAGAAGLPAPSPCSVANTTVSTKRSRPRAAILRR